MNPNPYEPPSIVLIEPRFGDRSWGSHAIALSPAWRAAIIGYGFLYASLCTSALAADVKGGMTSLAVNIYWTVFYAISCFGVFACAIPMLRWRKLASIWIYFAFALPFLLHGPGVHDVLRMNNKLLAAYNYLADPIWILTTPAIVLCFVLHIHFRTPGILMQQNAT